MRIETVGAGDLTSVYQWLNHRRGQLIDLDRTRKVELGVPITSAHAVIVALTLQDDQRPGTQVGGVLRALANRTEAEPVRLIFEGRVSPVLSAEAEKIAAGMVDAIVRLMAAGDAIAKVA